MFQLGILSKSNFPESFLRKYRKDKTPEIFASPETVTKQGGAEEEAFNWEIQDY